MKYYKIIKNKILLDIITDNNFRKYELKNKILLICKESEAQYVENIDGLLYRADWMSPLLTDKFSYKEANIIPIDEKEYDILFKALKVNKEIVFEEPESEIPTEEEIFIDPIEELTIDFIKTSKLTEMSSICNKTIINGFDITLSDGNSYHFSLTTQDQLNLITLATMVESGETQIPYHADGEPCKFYSTLDMKAIIDKATKFKTYHTSYYNSLKTYINSMETMEEISAVTYGIEIPQEYQSEVLKTLNK